MSLVDRIAGGSVEPSPSERTLFGRWWFAPRDGTESVYLNGQPAASGDVLSPDAAGEWALLRPGDASPIRGRFFPDALPDEQDVTALLQLGGMLRDPEKAKGGWLEWNETNPLAPGLDEAVKPHPLEDHIESELEHLVAVCRNPRTHIRMEIERVHVARARRIARNAPAWLASHTEDWDHRTITGIQPRRILAEIREERWDLYENRVAVRLVDNLVTWLRRRIAAIRRVLDDVLTRMEDFRVSTSGSRHRAERIYRLWGKAWDAGSRRDIAERTLRRLERLLYRVLGLMDSPLYRRLPGHAGTPRALRMTNVFRSHDSYRGVARLWLEWSRLAVPRALSPRELHDRHQNLHRSFDAWCMLVVLRACSQLKLDPSEDEGLESEIRPGCIIRLDKGFRLEWEQAGTITLAENDHVLLRFVPLIHVLECARTREAVTARVEPLVEAVAAAAHWTIILHPAVPGEPPHDALAGVGNPPAPTTTGAIDFIRVSPFSLDSVERVSRAIRWATLVPRMLAYPPDLQTSRELDVSSEPWFHSHGSSNEWMVRPLQSNELSKLNIEGRLTEARKRRDTLVHERDQVQEDLKQARGDRRRTRELNLEKSKLLEPVRDAEDAFKRLEKFKRDFEKARDQVDLLATCPACGTSAEFEARDSRCFFARCRSNSCDSRWELRHHPDTNTRIPVFLPSDFDKIISHAPPTASASHWVDEVFGCDVLAVPKRQDDGSFLSPRTERVGDSLELPDTESSDESWDAKSPGDSQGNRHHAHVANPR